MPVARRWTDERLDDRFGDVQAKFAELVPLLSTSIRQAAMLAAMAQDFGDATEGVKQMETRLNEKIAGLAATLKSMQDERVQSRRAITTAAIATMGTIIAAVLAAIVALIQSGAI